MAPTLMVASRGLYYKTCYGRNLWILTVKMFDSTGPRYYKKKLNYPEKMMPDLRFYC